jgi:rhodanese-related sulfurtransferase
MVFDCKDTFTPEIDTAGYLKAATAALAYRDSRRLPEEDFLRFARERGTVVLDARSREKYDELHIAGAINLSFPDIALEALRREIPNRSTRILIYCNKLRRRRGSLSVRLPAASLNLDVYPLYTYGYRNVWNLGPQVDLSIRSFASSVVEAGQGDARGSPARSAARR